MCLSSPRFPSSSLSCQDRGVQSRIGGERGWPRGTLFWLLVVRLMLHQGCKGAGWQCWSLLPTSQVHSGPVSLLLPGVAFCELPVISKPSFEPGWRGLQPCLPHGRWELGSQKVVVPAWDHASGLGLSAQLPSHLRPGQGLQSL